MTGFFCKQASRLISAGVLGLMFTMCAHAATYTWDGATALWSSANWLPGNVAGPTGSSNANSAFINGGMVSFAGNDTFTNAATVTSAIVTVNSGGTLASGGFFNTLWNPSLNSGTVLFDGGANPTFPAMQFCGTLTVTGSSYINVGSGSNNILNISGNGNATLTANIVNPTDLLTVNAPLQNGSGNGSSLQTSSLAKTGLGLLLLTASNTYSGSTTVTAGTLQLGTGASGNDGSIASTSGITNNSALVYDLNGSQTAGYPISGTGVLVKSGTGMLMLSGSNTYNGGTTITAGTLAISGTGSLGTSGNYSALISDSGALVVSTSSNQTFGGAISGSGSFYQLGGGITTLSASNTYTGGTTIKGGTLAVTGGANSLSTSGAITISNSATLDLGGNSQTTSAAVTLGSGSTLQHGTLTSTSATEAGNNQFTGTITLGSGGAFVTNGRLLMANGGSDTFALSATSSGSITFGGDNGGNENYVGVGGGSAVLTINGGTINFNNSTFGTGNGYLNVGSNSNTSSGTITVNGGNVDVGTWLKFGGNYNSIQGTNATSLLSITNGTVAVGGGSDTGSNGVLFMNGGTGDTTSDTGNATLTLNTGGVLIAKQIQTGNHGTDTINLNGGTIVAGSGASSTFLAAASPLTVNIQNGGGTINSGTSAITVAANIAGAGSSGLTTIGAGTLTLSGSNTYSGGTTVNSGTLALGSVLALGGSNAGPLNVNGGAFNLAGYSPTPASNFSLTLAGGSIVNSGTLATLTATAYNVQNGLISANLGGATSALTMTTGGLVTLSGSNNYGGATTVSAGTLALSSASGNNIAASPTINVGAGSTLNTTGLSGGGLVLGTTQTLTGQGTVNGGLTTSGTGSTITPGSITSIGTLNTGTLNLTAGGALNFYLGSAGTSVASPGPGSLVNVAGNLNLPSTQTITLNLNGTYGNGYYDLFNYSGTLTSSPSAAFGLGTGASTYAYSTITNGPTNELILQISVPSLNWTGLTGGTGAVNSNWDAVSTNWSNNANNSAQAYVDGSIVTFGDTNAVTGGSISNSNVSLNAIFSPASITFSNSAVNYAISGSGGIAGGTGITINGTGLVSLSTSNSFTGAVLVNAGVLNISNSAALGNSVGVAVANGAALQLQGGIATGTIPLGLSGTGLAASPAGALNNVSGANTYAGAITLNSPSTITASAGTLTLSGGLSNGSNLLTIDGAGTTIIAYTTFSPGSGGLAVTPIGTLNFTAPVTLAVQQLWTNNGALDVTGNVSNGGNLLELAGTGTTTFSIGTFTAGAGGLTVNSGVLNLNGPVAVAAPQIWTNNGDLAVTGNVGNGGNLLTLAGTGTTTFSSGTFTTGSGGLTVSSGSVGLNGPVNLTAPQTWTNDGTLAVGGGVANGGNLLTFAGSGNASFSAALSGSGGLTMSGNGLLNLTGTDTYTGATLVSAGTLGFAAGSLLASASNLNSQGGGVLSITGTVTMANGGAFGTGAGLTGTTGTTTVNPGAVLTIGGSNSYVAIGGGFVNAANTAKVAQYGIGTLNINGGLVNVGAAGTSSSGPASTDATSLWLNPYGDSGTGGSAINLNGGTLSTARPIGYGGSGAPFVNFNGGTLQAAANINLINSTLITVDVQAGGAVINTNGFNTTVAPALLGSGGGGVTKVGSGTLTLSSDGSNYTGNLTIAAGTLATGTTDPGTLNPTASELGNPQVARNIAIDSGATVTMARSDVLGNAGSTPVATLLISGGTVQDNGFFNTLGALTFNNGGLLTGSVGASSGYQMYYLNGTVTVTGSGSALIASTSASGNNGVHLAAPTTFNVDPNGGDTSSLTISAPLINETTKQSGAAGSMLKTGSGFLSLTGANTYSGGTRVSGGTLQLGNTFSLGYGGLTANAGVVDLNSWSPSVASLSGSSGVITNSSSTAATLNVTQSIATTFSGTIQDGGSSVGLSLNSGTLTLLGNNTHSGPTTISGGALYAGAVNTLSPNSAVTLSSGLLDVTAGSQTIAGLTIYSGALNLHAGNLLTSTAYSSLGGVLNISGTTAAPLELISLPGGYTGTFTAGIIPAGYTLSYSNTNQVDLVLSSVSSAAWTSSLGGSWTGSSNWSSNPLYPSGQAVTALLGGALAASGTVTLDGPQTVGTLIFSNSAASYSLTAGNSGSLTLDNTGGTGSSQIIVLAGTHSIAVPLTIANGPALISLINSGSLDISGDISEAGGSHSLSLSSSDATGVLSLDGSNSFSGGVYVNSGTLLLNGANALAPGSTLVIGTTSPPSTPSDREGMGDPSPNPPFSSAAAPILAPVPEPGTFVLVTIASLAAVGIWRRKKSV